MRRHRMNRPLAEHRDDALRPSILDRLIAGETGAGTRSVYEYVGVRELRDSIARDLEWLLNTKFTEFLDLEKFPEAKNSILTYGVPDFSTYSRRNDSDGVFVTCTIDNRAPRYCDSLTASRTGFNDVAVSPAPVTM